MEVQYGGISDSITVRFGLFHLSVSHREELMQALIRNLCVAEWETLKPEVQERLRSFITDAAKRIAS